MCVTVMDGSPEALTCWTSGAKVPVTSLDDSIGGNFFDEKESVVTNTFGDSVEA